MNFINLEEYGGGGGEYIFILLFPEKIYNGYFLSINHIVLLEGTGDYLLVFYISVVIQAIIKVSLFFATFLQTL